MIAAQTTPLFRPTHARPWGALVDFLRRELAPYPGRTVATVRIVVACVIVLVLCMTLRVPEAYLSVWVVTRFSMEESSQTLLTAIVALLALTVGLAIALVCLTFAMDQAWLRFSLMAAMAAAGLFLRRTFVIGLLGFVIGLIGTLGMYVPDFIPLPELAVRFTLWFWPVFALAIAAAVAANLLIAPTDPEILLRAEISDRMLATEQSLSNRSTRGAAAGEARQFATAGVTRLLSLLKSAAVVHSSVRAHHSQYSALITLVDRLVAAAATLELISTAPLQADDNERLQYVAAQCARLRRVFEDRTVTELSERPASGPPSPGNGSAVLPAIVELEHTIELLHQALGPEGTAASEVGPATEGSRLFVPDAFSNTEYVQYALKGSLAVMFCYVLQTAVKWPGIRTCMITCLIVGLTSEGATLQKGTLRIAGALVGGALGFLSILFLIPWMESITSLTVLVAAGAAVAAWVIVGSQRIAYVGVQIAFAFFLCVVQGFQPTWYFYTIRDRLVGILLGNAVITLVFHYVWPVRASAEMWRSLASALRTMARLPTVGARSENQMVVAAEAQSLRLQASREFAAAQQAADQAAFEPSFGALQEIGLAQLQARERLQRAVADAQSIFLTQLTIARQRPNVAPVELPEVVVKEVRGFDALVAESLIVAADRVEHGAEPPLPNLGAALAASTALIRVEAVAITSPATAAEVEARLALYRELVPRLERLAVAEFAR